MAGVLAGRDLMFDADGGTDQGLGSSGTISRMGRRDRPGDECFEPLRGFIKHGAEEGGICVEHTVRIAG